MKEINYLEVYREKSTSKTTSKIIFCILLVATILNVILTIRNFILVNKRIKFLGEEKEKKEEIILLKESKKKSDINDFIINDKEDFTKDFLAMKSKIPRNTYFKRIYISSNAKIIDGDSKYREEIFLFSKRLKEYDFQIKDLFEIEDRYFEYRLENFNMDDGYEE